jgi:hypothetical protein
MERHYTMAIFGKNGFVRKQEVAFAKRLIVWKYKESGTVLPDNAAILVYAEKVVDDAHNIAKKRGSNVLEIMKDTIKKIKFS